MKRKGYLFCLIGISAAIALSLLGSHRLPPIPRTAFLAEGPTVTHPFRSAPVTGREAPNQPRLVETYGRLPLSFEVNRGQTDSRVKFLTRGRGHALFLTSDEAVLTLARSQEPGFKSQESGTESKAPAVLHMKLVGANARAEVAGLQELPGKVNYFIGNDLTKWRTNVATFAKVKYQNVYPGVDLIYYGNQGQLEYDFVLAPGADLDAITLAVEAGMSSREADSGAGSALHVAADGDLVIRADGGEVRFHKPVVYQLSASTETPVPSQGSSDPVSKIQSRKYLNGHYVLTAHKHVRFEVAGYDKGRPLVIDPVLSYSTYLGGSVLQYGSAIAVDASGNAYVTGTTESTDFPTMNPSQATFGGSADAFVAKLNAAGSALVYSTYLGGSGQDRAYGIAVDSSGNAYVMGGTESTDFPTMNPFQARNAGGSDVFVAKLNATGSALVYSTYLGGRGNESQPGFKLTALTNQGGIAVDSSGNAYVAGYTDSTDFPTANPFQAANAGGVDGFVVKLNPAGNGLVYSTYLGGTSNDIIGGIAVDSAGNSYVTGSTNSTNFPTASPFQATNKASSYTAFVTKLSAAGNALTYSTYLGGSSEDLGGAIAVDSSANAFITGLTCSTDFPTVNAFQAADPVSACNVAFVTKFNPAGSALVYSTYLGGSFDEAQGSGIAVDSLGNAYVTGQTLSGNFPTANPLQAVSGGGSDDFVVKLDAAGNASYSTYLGSSGVELGGGIAVDSSGNAYVTGGTTGSDFPTLNPFQATCGGFSGGLCGATNVFVSKISPANVAAVSLAPAGLGFPDQFVNTTSAPQTLVLRNVGSAGLTISSISITGANSGDFSLTGNTCVASLAGGMSCTLTVTFRPTMVAVETAAVTVTDSATGSPQDATLTGRGVMPPVVSLSPTSLAFGDQLVGTTSASKTVTVTNTGGSALTGIAVGITGSPVTLDFTAFDTCAGSPLPVGASCTITVNFTPVAPGPRTDEVFMNDDAPGSPQIIPLSGTGTVDFGVAVAPGTPPTATVTAGQSATYTIDVTPLGGSNQTVTMSCAGAPSHATCTASPSAVSLDGTHPATVTVTVSTSASALVAARAVPPPPIIPHGPLALYVFALATLVLWSMQRKRVSHPGFLILGLMLFSLTWLAACGGGGGAPVTQGTPAGTYTLTVTGTSGSLSHSANVGLTVN